MSINILIETDKRLALGIYRLSKKLGDLSRLSTQSKGTLVDALNELAQPVETDSVNTDTVNQLIQEKISQLIDSAPEELNTLKELGDAIKKGDTSVQAILREIATLKEADVTINGKIQQIEQSLVVDSQWPNKIDRLMATGEE